MNTSQLQSLCGAWPGAACMIKNEDDLVCRVAGKVFAVLCLRGPEHGRLSCKVDADRFLELTEQPGIIEAHFAARPFWITLTEPERFSVDETARFVRRSYELVQAGLSARQQATLAAVSAPTKRAARKRKA